MQMQLPLFPPSTKLINSCVGFFEKDDFVYYLHNGSPIFCHGKNDLNSYRYITANLVTAQLCTPIELSSALGVSSRNIQRYSKTLREKGTDWFFQRVEKRGDAHKLTSEKLQEAQKMIDGFHSVVDVARLLGVTEGALRYHIKKGNIKKKVGTVRELQTSIPSERNQQDILASHLIGMGATRTEERALAVNHQLETTPVDFESCQSVPQAGVLILLPFLEQTGLFSFREHYRELKKGYYYIDFIVLFLAFMYLRRIKNPEQLKYHSPGEFGKIMGLDRIPEAKCLRGKLKEICSQGKSEQWNMALANQWSCGEDNEFYYIDGHVQVYTGHKATLGKKHVSRQKLCLPGVQEFWVNNKEGLPYFYVSGQVNEKLIEMLETQIVPALLNGIQCKYSQQELLDDPDLPRFTIVFDREAYSPVFFQKLWEQHRVAVITYRKNVKDKWDEKDFAQYTVDVDGNDTKMYLAEKPVTLNNVAMREIRRLSGEHQTSVITTNKKLSVLMVAIYMFSRWTQENFFKYLRQDYDFDRMLQYAVEQVDKEFVVNNPEYNNITYKIGKTREKISRKKAALYVLQEQNLRDDLDKTNGNLRKQLKIKEGLKKLESEEDELLQKRKKVPSQLKIEEMPDNIRYDKLNVESKRFQNIIKIICYRAETSCANLIPIGFKKSVDEKRAVVKSFINSHADIIPDYKNNILTIMIYGQANPRMNKALENVIKLLNETETKYPGTNLVLNYKIAT
jgi:hypothetical protein